MYIRIHVYSVCIGMRVNAAEKLVFNEHYAGTAASASARGGGTQTDRTGFG